jgi:hypothetical protein
MNAQQIRNEGAVCFAPIFVTPNEVVLGFLSAEKHFNNAFLERHLQVSGGGL